MEGRGGERRGGRGCLGKAAKAMRGRFLFENFVVGWAFFSSFKFGNDLALAWVLPTWDCFFTCNGRKISHASVLLCQHGHAPTVAAVFGRSQHVQT